MRAGAFIAVGFAISAMSCLNPTEIVVVLSTNVACGLVTQNGIAIALGAPGDDQSGIATTTKLCSDDGGIGTVVLLPHGSIDQSVGIRVTLGIEAGADQCPPPDFPGCIVARRSLRFDPHTPLTLPIDLDQACIGVPCTKDSTCVSGLCVDAGVVCEDASCVLDDSGVPDAAPASCQPIQDLQVMMPTGSAARVAVSSDGWAVAWQTASSGVDVADLHLSSGGTLNVSQPLPLVPANNATQVGPLAVDASGYAISYANGSNAFATIVGLDGTPRLTGPFSYTSAMPASFGMFPLGQATYATALISAPNASASLTTFSPQYGSNGSSAGITATSLTDISLAQGSSFYASLADQGGACTVFTCSHNGGFFCTPMKTFPPPCSAVRVAERLGVTTHVVDSNKILTIDDVYPLNATVAGTSFQVIATSLAFHVVFVTPTGALMHVTYDGKSTPTIQQIVTTGTVLAIDTVADGPTQPGFAIVYSMAEPTSVTSVHFMHMCQ